MRMIFILVCKNFVQKSGKNRLNHNYHTIVTLPWFTIWKCIIIMNDNWFWYLSITNTAHYFIPLITIKTRLFFYHLYEWLQGKRIDYHLWGSGWTPPPHLRANDALTLWFDRLHIDALRFIDWFEMIQRDSQSHVIEFGTIQWLLLLDGT